VIPDDICTAHAFDLLKLDDKDLRPDTDQGTQAHTG
jgi:hypothetical protein